ncbi:hypothetical protein GGI43DRAFT_430081 [Trichoderma evansii]
MKSSYVLLNIAAFCGAANGFWGQLSAKPKQEDEGGIYQWLYLTDYNTGSQYAAQLTGGFGACAPKQCSAVFFEINDSAGHYSFSSLVWRSSDGCHHIDFQGDLDSHAGYCCGSLPCDISA